MNTCKDCFHYAVCSYLEKNGDGRVLKNSPCFNFKDKSQIIELPMKTTTKLLEELTEYCINRCVEEL